MKDRILSIFIDESGDFGTYESHSPYYIVSMVLHNQATDISKNIYEFKKYIENLGYGMHAVHTGPLIRRESVYRNDLMENRKRLFNALFHFVRKLDIQYACVKIKKAECRNVIDLTAKLSKGLAEILQAQRDNWNRFNQLIVYYDNGQIELTKILTSVFSSLYVHVDYRKVQPSDYILFQTADLICTMELLSIKADNNSFSSSEKEFFGSIRDFRKNYLKHILKKQIY